MSSYSQHRGRSIGRILHYINEYCGLQYAESIIFEEGAMITYRGAPFAKVEWRKTGFKGVEVPWFEFLGDYVPFRVSQERINNMVMDSDIARELDNQLNKARELLEKVPEPHHTDRGAFLLWRRIKDFLKGL